MLHSDCDNASPIDSVYAKTLVLRLDIGDCAEFNNMSSQWITYENTIATDCQHDTSRNHPNDPQCDRDEADAPDHVSQVAQRDLVYADPSQRDQNNRGEKIALKWTWMEYFDAIFGEKATGTRTSHAPNADLRHSHQVLLRFFFGRTPE